MSRFSHRQPVLTWGSVVLLSTLLFAPGISAPVVETLLRAFVSSLPHPVAPVESALAQQPRRSAEEEEALRAARNGTAYLVRFDTDPEHPDHFATALAVLLPSRGVVRVSDADTGTARDFPGRSPTIPGYARPGVPPRAPPV